MPWADLLGVAAYGVCTALFFWRVVGQGLVPTGYDLLVYFYPYKAYVAELLRQGQLPLWNPLVYMGVPLLGNIQIGVLYPPNLLFYLLPTVDGLRSSIVLHTFLAGLFTYLFARVSLGLSPLAAWLAGAIFAFGGFIGGRGGHLNVLHSAVWLPALLLCLEQAMARRSVRVVALGALVYATQILAGHTQEVYYSGLVMGLFALYLAATQGLTPRALLWPLGAVAGMAAGAAAVAGVQLLPALELARESYRSGGVPYSAAVTYSVHLNQLLDSILPTYIQIPYIELNGYVAVAALPLVPAALAWNRAGTHRWFFAGLGLLALLLAVGDGTPLYGWFHRWVPGFDLFRAPGRWLLVFGLSASLLAGMGVESLGAQLNGSDLRRWLERYGLGLAGGVATLAALRLWLPTQGQELDYPNPRVILTWGLFILAATAGALVLASRPRFRLARLGLVVLVLLELYLAKEPQEYNVPVDPSLYTAPPFLSASLTEDRSFRMLSLAGERSEPPEADIPRADLPASMTRAEVERHRRFARLKELMPPDVGMVFGVSSLDGSDGGILPTHRWAELKRALLGSRKHQPDLTMRDESEGAAPDSRMLGAFGVRHLLLDGGAGYDAGWEVVEKPEGGRLTLLRNSAALPRAHVVHAARVLEGDEQELEAVRSLDLGKVVVLGEKVSYDAPADPGRDEVVLVRDGPGEVVVEVSLEQPGFLVLSDSYYPGWKAYLNGQEVRLLRANYAVRAVQLPAGSHQVRFAFEPLSFRVGLGVTVLSLMALAAVLLPRASLRAGPGA